MLNYGCLRYQSSTVFNSNKIYIYIYIVEPNRNSIQSNQINICLHSNNPHYISLVLETYIYLFPLIKYLQNLYNKRNKSWVAVAIVVRITLL